jgi:arsenite methyltransferase
MTDYLNQKYDYQEPGFVALYDELTLWSARFGILMLDKLPLTPGKVLDIGCGTGFPILELAHLWGDDSRFVGLDLWQAALHWVNRKKAFYKLSNVELVIGDGAKIPFPANHFDLIVSNLGLNNFAHPSEVFAECHRVLKPGAIMALTTNVSGHFQEFYAVYRQVLTDLGKASALAKLSENETHRGTPETVSNLARQADFSVTKAVVSPATMGFANSRAMFRHFLVNIGFLDGWCAVLEPQDERLIFAELEARLDVIAKNSGVLTMTVPMLYLEIQKPDA